MRAPLLRQPVEDLEVARERDLVEKADHREQQERVPHAMLPRERKAGEPERDQARHVDDAWVVARGAGRVERADDAAEGREGEEERRLPLARAELVAREHDLGRVHQPDADACDHPAEEDRLQEARFAHVADRLAQAARDVQVALGRNHPQPLDARQQPGRGEERERVEREHGRAADDRQEAAGDGIAAEEATGLGGALEAGGLIAIGLIDDVGEAPQDHRAEEAARDARDRGQADDADRHAYEDHREKHEAAREVGQDHGRVRPQPSDARREEQSEDRHRAEVGDRDRTDPDCRVRVVVHPQRERDRRRPGADQREERGQRVAREIGLPQKPHRSIVASAWGAHPTRTRDLSTPRARAAASRFRRTTRRARRRRRRPDRARGRPRASRRRPPGRRRRSPRAGRSRSARPG